MHDKRLGLIGAVLALSMFAPVAFAQDKTVVIEEEEGTIDGSVQEPGIVIIQERQEREEPGTAATTVAEEKEVTRGYLSDEVFGIKPQAGVIAFQDAAGEDASRLAAGLTFEWNFSTMAGLTESRWYVGPQTGFIFSHLGQAGSNFVGTDADTPIGDAGSNFLLIPADLKIGYNFGDHYRLSVHGGGNVIYRSAANSINMGKGSTGTGDLWKVYPNVGGALEIALSRTSVFLLRPDFTIAPNEDVFTGTIGFGWALG